MNKLSEAAAKAIQTFNEYNAALQECAALQGCKEQENKHRKGYIFDSLVYRYKLARHRMTEMEIVEERNSVRHHHDYDHYLKMEERDVMRFIEILEEAIGEHD